ncbi:MAG: hypothetical protein JST27_04265 [Bacteroidetes bacterium]|nr:hypothetical protein [Bacteroidota bacterium]
MPNGEICPNWNLELRNWLRTANQVFVNQFNENAINNAIAGARGHFNDHWCKEFITIACDPFDRRIVTIEQGAHQPENARGGGFKLHFTGRDNGGYAFHFYVRQLMTGQLEVTEMSYNDHGLKQVQRT